MGLYGELFGEDRLKKLYGSDALGTAIENQSADLPSWYTGIAKGATSDLINANPGLVKAQAADTSNLLGLLQQVSGKGANFNAEATAGRWGDSQMGRLKDWANFSAGADSKAGKLAKARLGYAGRPSSSFEQFLRTSDFASALNPTANSILTGAAGDANSFGLTENSMIQAILQSLSAVPGAYTSVANSYLRPAQAANQVSMGGADLLQALAEAASTNLAGFTNDRKHGIGDYVQGFNDLLGGITGGGGGGGGGGQQGSGGGGGGGLGGIMSILGLLGAI